MSSGQRRRRRVALAEAQNWRCAYCGGVMEMDAHGPALATIEHLILRRGKTRRWRDNCVSACWGCNSARGDQRCFWAFYERRRKLLRAGVWLACSHHRPGLESCDVDAIFPGSTACKHAAIVLCLHLG